MPNMLLETSGEITPERMKGQNQSYDPLIVLLSIYLEKTRIQKKYIKPIVHICTIYNSQDMEMTQVHQRMNG